MTNALADKRPAPTTRGIRKARYVREQEAQLSQIANHAGTGCRAAGEGALRLLEQDARFRAARQKGIQATGNFRGMRMGQLFNGLSNLEQEALNDYATEKYFVQPKDTRGEVKDWVSNYAENLVKTNHSLVFEITRAYAKERGELYRTK